MNEQYTTISDTGSISIIANGVRINLENGDGDGFNLVAIRDDIKWAEIKYDQKTIITVRKDDYVALHDCDVSSSVPIHKLGIGTWGVFRDRDGYQQETYYDEFGEERCKGHVARFEIIRIGE